jgi:hypothetical protein
VKYYLPGLKKPLNKHIYRARTIVRSPETIVEVAKTDQVDIEEGIV